MSDASVAKSSHKSDVIFFVVDFKNGFSPSTEGNSYNHLSGKKMEKKKIQIKQIEQKFN